MNNLLVADFVFLFVHFFMCTLFFVVVQRPAFLFYNRNLAEKMVTWRDIVEINRYGLPTDIKVASYMTLFQVLVIVVHWSVPYFRHDAVMFFIDGLLCFFVSAACVADTALYRFWQFKIDKSVFAYLRSLRGVCASVSVSYILCALFCETLAFILLLLFVSLSYKIYNMCVEDAISYGIISRLSFSLLFLAVGVMLFLIIRGMKRRPQNTSIAYFSECQFFNHCALNPMYNMIYSITVKENFARQFQAFDKDYCDKKFASLFPTEGKPVMKLLNTDRPNILVVIWEGLCSHFIGSLGGDGNVCVNFDRLSKEGVFFTNCYAGSFRTDRGIVCVLSGYLGQPTTTVIRYARKLPHLPALPRTLRDKAGYSTTVVHGGDLTIFHKSDYYLSAGHDRLVYQKDFPKSAPACNWGIHDHYMFDWLYGDIQEKTLRNERWFTTLQTLSSHEPFEVPYSRIPDDKYSNSFAYVDDAFGRFIDSLKASPAWDNLLVVVTGDHGVNLDSMFSHVAKTHIPLLFLGGAVAKPAKIDTIISQTDIASTLLGQMNIDHSDFIFSRDVLADTYQYPFAFHAYNNGFIFQDETGYTDYDNVSKKALEYPDENRETLGKVILQKLYIDLSNR